jgi:hypothetical protein
MAQVLVRGTVYDRSQQVPLQAVSVLGTSGEGTVTDSLGHYSIALRPGDSLYFSYLGRHTTKIPVREITDAADFNMSIDIAVDSLPSILVNQRTYLFDSLVNRSVYQKVFDYKGGQYVDNMKANKRGAMGVNFDLDILLNPRADRRMEAMQQRLEDEEQQKYIDHRFTKAIVKKITGIEPPALDSFMKIYRPTYDFIISFETDWEFYQYILESGKFFIDVWRKEHPKP